MHSHHLSCALLNKLLMLAINTAHVLACAAELAGDLRATPLLLGMGLDEFSMMTANIPRVKHLVRNIS